MASNHELYFLRAPCPLGSFEGVGLGCSWGRPASERPKDRQRHRFRSCVGRNREARGANGGCHEGRAMSSVGEASPFSRRASLREVPL